MLKIAKEITGRHGDYDGAYRSLILTIPPLLSYSSTFGIFNQTINIHIFLENSLEITISM